MYMLGNPEANGIPFLDLTSLSNITDGIGNPQTRMGYIGRLNYDYANKYIIELSGRYDGSYRYKKENVGDSSLPVLSVTVFRKKTSGKRMISCRIISTTSRFVLRMVYWVRN